ncbi:cholesterol 7-dehydrogenase [Streptomyces sp. V3I8]|uniref:aromatic ring-hydroxylating oxygenase subunit alpha n=1 Tax=Streptomyces sp. V3I8 TaxID=3042279 RepID=UPI0027875167|nr:Rieske 2Fe-2S domain-containing protein [Streptomyces sp. V3I8]MDQ1034624.1 cholesterol 7-dehydrogenase [Streptomyces sp. V3I8]
MNRKSPAGLRHRVRPGAVPSRTGLAGGEGDRAPLPYPSGWFCLALSREVPAGAVVTRRFMGRDVVLYRTRSGVLRVVDAHCPHLGAHLGAGGAVDGEHLVCPFHRFAFDVGGSCVEVPGGAPPRATLAQFTVRERGRIIYVWHGHDAAPPAWEPAEIPDDRFAPVASWSTLLASHPQEVMESFVDYRHQPIVHNVSLREVVPPVDEGPLLRISFSAAIKLSVRLATITVEQGVVLSGLGLASGEVALHQVGVRLGVLLMATPVGPWQTHLRAVAMAETASRADSPRLRKAASLSWSAVTGQALVRTVAHQMRQDAMIWNRKRYEPNPRLTPEEGAIGHYRRWARQFYPPNTRPTGTS